MRVAVAVTNLGPYHCARLRALAPALASQGGEVVVYQVAGREERYSWKAAGAPDRFEVKTFFPGESLERIPRGACARAMSRSLEQDRPDLVAVTGYSRPESLAAIVDSNRDRRPVILLSETQRIDHPRVWWKEAVKRKRVELCASALVGGPPHKAYLEELGMPSDRISLGYNAVDHDAFAAAADRARAERSAPAAAPNRPYFLAVSRLVPEKNLLFLLDAYSEYRSCVPSADAWELVILGDGPEERSLRERIVALGLAEHVLLPGFIQAEEQGGWHARAGAFVHPSRMEPWGLAVNEAAAAALPLIVSDRAGASSTLVPDPPWTTGVRFDPHDSEALVAALVQVAGMRKSERIAIGERARAVASAWGPRRFASGFLEALEHARARERDKRRIRRYRPASTPTAVTALEPS